MKTATPAQVETIGRLRAQAEADGSGLFEVRYSAYIGAGCAAERGAIVVCVDGRIYAVVEKEGFYV